MGSTLTGTTIAVGYDSLLKTTDNGPITSTLKTITDGVGNDSQLQLSTSKTKADGAFEADNISFNDGTNKFKTIVLEIGNWDMDATASVTVAHGLADHTKIRGASLVIRRDNASIDIPTGGYATYGYDVGFGDEFGAAAIDATNVNIYRVAAGVYDSTDYNSTPFNRGWVTLLVEV